MRETGPEKTGMLPPERLLDGVPFRNTSVREEHGGGGTTLWAPVRKRWWMRPPFPWLLPLRGQRGFRLDAIGLAVWQACDGTRTVERIVEEFSVRHRVSFHEARIVVMRFLQDLTRRQLVAVVLDRRGG